MKVLRLPDPLPVSVRLVVDVLAAHLDPRDQEVRQAVVLMSPGVGRLSP